MPTFRNEVAGNDEHAIVGVSPNGRGVAGWSDVAYGVSGDSKTSAGVRGTSVDGRGTEGWSTNGEGVVGISANSTGVWGQTQGAATGVAGTSKSGSGVLGASESGAGVFATSERGEGAHAETNSPVVAAVAAFNRNPLGVGAAVYGKKEGNIGHAGYFDGHVHVTRSVSVEGDVMLTNADCAEEFTVADPALAPPGAVMVIGDGGDVGPCEVPYDHRVVGVVSGAGDYRPALVLDRRGGPERRPIALMGKVYCRVDADRGAIRPGDLLTTSATPGHAMRADDATRAPGATIGKALAALASGRGMIPILAILQ